MSSIDVWLASKSLDDLYRLLGAAALAVVIGVVIEEFPTTLKLLKFIRLSVVRGWKVALWAALRHWVEIVESLGFVILVIALMAENRLQGVIQTKEGDARSTSEHTIEDLKAKNLALEQALSPRVPDLLAITNALAPFSGTPFRVLVQREFEARRAGGIIAVGLYFAGWIGDDAEPTDEDLPEDVTIVYDVPEDPKALSGNDRQTYENERAASEALSKLSSKEHIPNTSDVMFRSGVVLSDSNTSWAPSKPFGTILIAVGSKGLAPIVIKKGLCTPIPLRMGIPSTHDFLFSYAAHCLRRLRDAGVAQPPE